MKLQFKIQNLKKLSLKNFLGSKNGKIESIEKTACIFSLQSI
nr:MAG TPA: hypothetical protein [Caudoviricetes sp.]DAU48583.1 MAG TPA: hypothetical protein [Caudoviricetes sp.]